MKITCRQSDLLGALNIVVRAAAARSTMPAYECVHIKAANGTLTLTCTDLQMGIESIIPSDVQTEGQLLLPARLLLEIVRKLPDGDIKIEARDNLSAVIRLGASRTTVQGMLSDEFPEISEIDDAKTVLVKQSLLRDMIRQTSFAVAVEETRPILTGCLVEVEEKEIRLVALDGFRLAMRKAGIEAAAPSVNAVVPGKYINEIARMLGEDGEIALGFGKTHLMADLGGARITIRLLEGEFIKYRQLLPTEHQLSVLTPCRELSECVDRASLMAKEGKTNLIRLHIQDDLMQITSNGEMGDAFEELKVDAQGQTFDIAFNVRYVSDMTKNIADEKILMRFSSPYSPCVVTPVDGDSFLYLLLPVRTYGA